MNDGSNHIILNVVCVLVLNENNTVKIPRRGYKLVKSLFGKYEEIPSEWEIKKFNEKIRLEYGAGLTARQRDNSGNPVYGSGGIIGLHSKPIVNGVGIVVARKGSLGNVFYEKQNFFPIDTVYYITKNETALNLLFLFYYLKKMKLENFAIVTSKPGISRNEIYSLKITIPPLQEQLKIASILSGVDALIESAQKTIEKTERLKKGLMQQLLARGINHKKFKSVKWLFGKEIQIPEEWEMSTIEGISKKLVSGGTPSTTILEYWNGDIPWTRSSILLDPYLKSGEKFITSEGLKNSSSVLIPKNNLLVSSRVSVGNISINAIDIAISQDVTGIIINKSYAQLEFLYWYLKQYIKKLVLISQGTTIKGFTRKELANLLIFLPSLSEQQKIASILSGVDAYIQKNQQYKERLEKLKKGLMQKLLTGQIRVKV